MMSRLNDNGGGAMVYLLLIVAVGAVFLANNGASAWSYAPGFCDVDATAMTSRMGAADDDGDDGFELTFSKSTDIATGETITVTLNHPIVPSIKGLLLTSSVMMDSAADNEASGEFSMSDLTLAAGFQVLSQTNRICDGSSTARIGHSNAEDKTLPISFEWTPTDPSNHTAVFEMIVVVSSRTSWFAYTAANSEAGGRHQVTILNTDDGDLAPTIDPPTTGPSIPNDDAAAGDTTAALASINNDDDRNNPSGDATALSLEWTTSLLLLTTSVLLLLH